MIGYSLQSLVDRVNTLDEQNVKLTGYQVIGGVKAFTDTPIISTREITNVFNNTSTYSSDFDSLTDTGSYAVSNLANSHPGLSGVNWVCAVSQGSNFNNLRQVATSHSNTPRSFTRVRNGGTWSGWVELANQSDVDELADARDNDTVDLTTAQTINGAKKFGSTIEVTDTFALKAAANLIMGGGTGSVYIRPNVALSTQQLIVTPSGIMSSGIAQGTGGSHLTRKDYVDNLDGENVKVTGDQTVYGLKTFRGDNVGETIGDDSEIVRANAVSANTVRLVQGVYRASAGADWKSTKAYLRHEVDAVKGARIEFSQNSISLSPHWNVDAEDAVSALLASSSGVFTGLPQSTSSNALTRKDYVDGLVDDLEDSKVSKSLIIASGSGIDGGGNLTTGRTLSVDSTVVRTTGTQTIAGSKTFTGQILSGSSHTSNPLIVMESYPSTDAYLARLGSNTDQFSWDIMYRGSTTGAYGNSFVIVSSEEDAKELTMDHAGNFVVPRAFVNEDQQTADNALTRKDYVDNLDGANVKTTGTQTIAGAKTFSTMPLVAAGQSTTSNALVKYGTYSTAIASMNSTISGKAEQTISLTAGDGLSGGGNLGANRTFAVDSTVIRTTGDQNLGGVKSFSAKSIHNSGAWVEGGPSTELGIGGTAESPHHVIASNDGGGNFNFRIGNVFRNSAHMGTETGTAYHLLANNDSGNGDFKFNISNCTAGEAITDWKTPLWFNDDGVYTGLAQNVSTSALTRKDYVDNLDSANVKTSGTQTIAGAKTFTSSPQSSATQGTGTNHLVKYSTLTSVESTLESSIATKAPSSRTLTAGDGLSGGGTLAANRTFAVDSTVVRTTGDQNLSGQKTFTETLRSDTTSAYKIRFIREVDNWGLQRWESASGVEHMRFGLASSNDVQLTISAAGAGTGTGVSWWFEKEGRLRLPDISPDDDSAVRKDYVDDAIITDRTWEIVWEDQDNAASNINWSDSHTPEVGYEYQLICKAGNLLMTASNFEILEDWMLDSTLAAAPSWYSGNHLVPVGADTRIGYSSSTQQWISQSSSVDIWMIKRRPARSIQDSPRD